MGEKKAIGLIYLDNLKKSNWNTYTLPRKRPS